MSEGNCTFCGSPINPDRDYRKVTGWERRRDQGGTNAIRLREPTNEWACMACINLQAKGPGLAQTALI